MGFNAPVYRLYHIENDRIVAVEELPCEEDDAARAEVARRLLWPNAELWCGARLVAGYGRTGQCR